MYFPFGTPFYHMYLESPFPEQRILAEKVDEDMDLFIFENGLLPWWIQEEIINEGMNGKKTFLDNI